MKSIQYAVTAVIASWSANMAIAQQAIPVRSLAPALARSSASVSDIVEIRELPDRRILVNVPFQVRLVMFDTTLAMTRTVMDTAAPKNPYPRTALSLIPFVGDSTLIADVSSQAFSVLDPKGEWGRSVAPPSGRDFRPMSVWAAVGKPGTDAKGRMLYQSSAAHPYVVPPGNKFVTDTLPSPLYAAVLLRADFAARSVDTLALMLNLGARRYLNRNTPDVSTLINPALPAIDDWAVLSDGSVAIVRGHDYHIDWIFSDGTSASTPPMPMDWRRVTEDDKRAKLDSAHRILDSLRAADADPFQITTFTTSGKTVIHPRLTWVTTDQMADYAPPFRGGTLRSDADGNLWILPSTSSQAGAGLLYDVVNKHGVVFQRVRLPAGRIIAGFGRGGVVYLVAKADDGQWYLERTRVAG